MFYDILDKKRMDLLPLFTAFKERFYLAGGTGLALQLGHRDSVDFDFFTSDHFDTVALHRDVLDFFSGRKIETTLEEKDSINIVIDGEIKLSFLRYPYKLLNPCLDEKYFRIASAEDIGCMKLSAIVSRATWKDYIDLYFVLKKNPLDNLLKKMAQKIPDLDRNLILKSLVYFGDVLDEKIMFQRGFEVSRKEVEGFLEKQVKALFN